MFEKGSKVEVMNKTELPTSWCVAEVISGNRHTYKLRYDCYPISVQKVSKEFIRPCPPPLSKYLQSWVADDIVEVYDDEYSSWKTATVCNISDGGHFVIRLHGSSAQHFNVHQTNIRTRQSWKDGQWVPIVKISGSNGDVSVNKQMVEPNFHTNFGLQIPIPEAKKDQENDSNLLLYIDAGVNESRVVSSKTLKKASPFCSSYLHAYPENYKKLKTSGKERIDSFTFTEDRQIQASFYNAVYGNFYEKQLTSEPNESDNEDCSVGSCSNSNDSATKWSSPYVITSNDAQSFNTSRDEGRNSCSSPGEKAAENIHRLELNAYRSTLDALYAYGPLSWDKEALLTNLRINLHISNDEHLTELRNLISGSWHTKLLALNKHVSLALSPV